MFRVYFECIIQTPYTLSIKWTFKNYIYNQLIKPDIR